MKNNNIDRAKELFFKYGGSAFHRDRDPDGDEYDSYSVSKEQEFKWVNDFFLINIDQFDLNNDVWVASYFSVIYTFPEERFLKAIYTYILKNIRLIQNPYTPLYITQQFFWIIKKKKVSYELTRKILLLIEQLLAIALNIKLNPDFLITHFSIIRHNHNESPEEYIVKEYEILKEKLNLAKANFNLI